MCFGALPGMAKLAWLTQPHQLVMLPCTPKNARPRHSIVSFLCITTNRLLWPPPGVLFGRVSPGSLCPCVPVSLCPCILASLCPGFLVFLTLYDRDHILVSLCFCVLVYLCPCVFVSLTCCDRRPGCCLGGFPPGALFPCVPMYLSPCVPVSWCPLPTMTAAWGVVWAGLPRWPYVPVSLCPCVPMSLRLGVPHLL